MFRSIAVWMLLGSCLLVRTGVADVIVPVSQDRWVRVSALAVDLGIPESAQSSDSLAAATFDTFNADTTVNAAITNAVATCSGTQASQILGSSIVATGSMSANGDGYDYEARGTATGASHCDVTFTVTEPSLFTLSGTLIASGTGASGLTLDGPSGSVVAVTGGANQTTPVLEVGSLVTGTYSLSVSVSGTAIGDFFVYLTAAASYDISLALTTATDVPVVAVDLPRAAPNPFRDITWIRGYSLGTENGRLLIRDVRGRLVREFASPRGRGAVAWDGRDDRGQSVAPGVYFVRFAGEPGRPSLKVTRLR